MQAQENIQHSSNVRECAPVNVIVGGGTTVRITKMGSIKMADEIIEFDALISPNFGPNTMSVQTLKLFKQKERVELEGQEMQVYDANGYLRIKGFLCSDSLYQWWPEWKQNNEESSVPSVGGAKEKMLERTRSGGNGPVQVSMWSKRRGHRLEGETEAK